ncbi:MAG: hypothetical protein F2667_11915 [Actinobacteria bacterium]|uniref:Unannotated protein n=1 Tax=freshwater metagenome TaxID=449393 RepID=A0A6J6RTC2_9ZZZZ|nr:hypothetical protein [Actinomycetota bacterium]
MSACVRAQSQRPEQGAATVLAVACLAVLLLLGVALGEVAALVRAHRQAQSAADLAALAGAGAGAAGAGSDACDAAARIARANHARLVGCALSGADVTVTAEVSGPHWLGRAVDLDASARAGPG